MTPLNIAKGALVAVGVALFFLGIQSGQEMLRYAGITLVVIAWLLRFAARSTTRNDPPRSSSEETR